jgi:hypothetical protein
MTVKAKALPAGWSKVLDDVHVRLDQAIALANARMEAMPTTGTTAAAPDRRADIAQWVERLDRLGELLTSADQVVQSVDELLHREQTAMEQQLAACKTLRQKAG